MDSLARRRDDHSRGFGIRRGGAVNAMSARTHVGWTSQVVRHAFISYVREDSQHVDRLQRRLEDAGVQVWRDTVNLWPGEDWRAKIRQAIEDDALVFIACFSVVSLARPKSYQNEELNLGIEQLRLRHPDDPWLIPVRFDECDIPDRDIGGGRTLRSIQCADLFGDQANEGITRLVSSVLRISAGAYQAAATVHAGPVAIPQFGTLEQISVPSSALQFSSAAPAEVKGDTKPLPAMTSEYLAAMAEPRNGHLPSSAGEVRGRHRKSRSGGSITSWTSAVIATVSYWTWALYATDSPELEYVAWRKPTESDLRAPRLHVAEGRAIT